MNKIKPKSFSELWEDAENIASGWYDGDKFCDLCTVLHDIIYASVIRKIEENKEMTDEEAHEKAFGEALFIMAHLSKKYNVNVYTALGKHVMSKKEEVLENTLGGEADLFRGQSKS